MPTNKTQYSLNYGPATDLTTGTITNGIGVADPLDINSGTFALESGRFYPIMNNIVLTNYDATGTPTTPTTKFFLKDAYKLMKFYTPEIRNVTLSAATTIEDIFGTYDLFFPAPLRLTSATTYAHVTNLSGATVNGLLNFGTEIGKLRFGFKFDYESSNVPTTSYYVPSPALPSWTAMGHTVIGKYAYPVSIYTGLSTIGLGTTPTTMPGYFASAYAGGDNPTILSAFNVAYVDIDAGTTWTISPIMFISADDDPANGYVSTMALATEATVASATITRPTDENRATITMANTDSAVNTDAYVDGHGWVGTYNPGATTDSSITITIVAGA